LVARTPYGKAELGELFYLDPWTAARRGFIVVLQDVRGRGLSEGGEWTPFAYEALDGYDTIEWAAALPGSNGRVGTWGASYLGNVQLQAALLRPPSLKAIALAARMGELIAAVDAIPGETNEALPAHPDAIIDGMSLPDLGHPDAVQASNISGQLSSLTVRGPWTTSSSRSMDHEPGSS
jgi:putative CocE/NonD family hydrolase